MTTTTDDDLSSFIYAQVDAGYMFEGRTSYCMLGDQHHYFHVWAMRSPEPDLLSAQFRRDIDAWVTAAGTNPTIVVRTWPQWDPQTEEGLWQLYCRLLIVNRFYRDVPPSFIPKPQGEDAKILGGTDD